MRILTLALVTVVALTTVAAAGSDADFARHLNRGVSLYEQQQYAEAIPEFELAFIARPLPRLLFNLAQAHRKLNHVEESLRYYEAYERAAASQLTAEERNTLRGYIDAQRALLIAQSAPPAAPPTPATKSLVPRRTLIITPLAPSERLAADPPPAPLSTPSSGPPPAPPSTPPGRALPAALSTPPGRPPVAALPTPTPPIAVSAQPSLLPVPRAEAPPPITLRSPALAAIGFTSAGALLIGAIATGTIAYDASRRLRDQASPTRHDYEVQQSSVSSLALATDVLAATTAAAFTLGVIGVSTRRQTPDRVTGLHLQLSPSQILVGGGF